MLKAETMIPLECARRGVSLRRLARSSRNVVLRNRGAYAALAIRQVDLDLSQQKKLTLHPVLTSSAIWLFAPHVATMGCGRIPVSKLVCRAIHRETWQMLLATRTRWASRGRDIANGAVLVARLSAGGCAW